MGVNASAYGVEAAMECLLRNAADVIPVAGTLEAMNDDDDGRVLGLPGLPVTMSEQAGFWIDLKQPGFGGRDVEAPWYKGRDDGHGVAVFQKQVWLKRRKEKFHSTDCISRMRCRQAEPDAVGVCPMRNEYGQAILLGGQLSVSFYI